MRLIIYLLLIISTYAQNGSNASNTTGDGFTNTSNASTTTALHSITTTLGPTSTVPPTTTDSPPQTTTQQSTTTTFRQQTTTVVVMPNVTTTTIPYCSSVTNDTACKVCLGPLCKFVERGEQGVGWEILFVAFALGIIGLAGLCLYYICLRPLLTGNPAEDIYWDDSDDEDEWSEATPLNKDQIRSRSGSRARVFEIVDLNPPDEK